MVLPQKGQRHEVCHMVALHGPFVLIREVPQRRHGLRALPSELIHERDGPLDRTAICLYNSIGVEVKVALWALLHVDSIEAPYPAYIQYDSQYVGNVAAVFASLDIGVIAHALRLWAMRI